MLCIAQGEHLEKQVLQRKDILCECSALSIATSDDNILPYRSSTKYCTTLNIATVPAAPKNSRTTPENSDTANQYLVLVRYR